MLQRGRALYQLAYELAPVVLALAGREGGKSAYALQRLPRGGGKRRVRSAPTGYQRLERIQHFGNAPVARAQRAQALHALAGFGVFEAKEREARTGRNPKTGETIEIPASRTPVFKAGKGLKDKVAK